MFHYYLINENGEKFSKEVNFFAKTHAQNSSIKNNPEILEKNGFIQNNIIETNPYKVLMLLDDLIEFNKQDFLARWATPDLHLCFVGEYDIDYVTDSNESYFTIKNLARDAEFVKRYKQVYAANGLNKLITFPQAKVYHECLFNIRTNLYIANSDAIQQIMSLNKQTIKTVAPKVKELIEYINSKLKRVEYFKNTAKEKQNIL